MPYILDALREHGGSATPREVYDTVARLAKVPDDSHGPRWRGPCMAGGEGGGQEAGAVTVARVRCNAWLAVAVIWE